MRAAAARMRWPRIRQEWRNENGTKKDHISGNTGTCRGDAGSLVVQIAGTGAVHGVRRGNCHGQGGGAGAAV